MSDSSESSDFAVDAILREIEEDVDESEEDDEEDSELDSETSSSELDSEENFDSTTGSDDSELAALVNDVSIAGGATQPAPSTFQPPARARRVEDLVKSANESDFNFEFRKTFTQTILARYPKDPADPSKYNGTTVEDLMDLCVYAFNVMQYGVTYADTVQTFCNYLISLFKLPQT